MSLKTQDLIPQFNLDVETKKRKKDSNRFLDGIEILLPSLKEIAAVHPVAQAVVGAFSTLFQLQSTRCENDERIRLLFLEIRYTVSRLERLHPLTSLRYESSDVRQTWFQLDELMKEIEDEIRACGNTIDVYRQKRLIVKAVQSIHWEKELKGFGEKFIDYRGKLDGCLEDYVAYHSQLTAQHVEDIKQAVRGIKQDAEDIKHCMIKVFMSVFYAGEPESLREMKKLAPTDMQPDGIPNDSMLKEMMKRESDLSPKDRRRLPSPYILDDLKHELTTTVQQAIADNTQVFKQMFDTYYVNTIRTIQTIMGQGPHENIRSTELQELWQSMGWKRNVKSKRFVITLHDHFHDKIRKTRYCAQHPEDAWTLRYISVHWLHGIMEAFDDDYSGYVTIDEVNMFTGALPPEIKWSMQKWVAYWAVGWRFTALYYKRRIHSLIFRMHALGLRSLPGNRMQTDVYLNNLMTRLVPITISLRKETVHVPSDLLVHFKEYIQFEESRLENKLIGIRYEVHSPDKLWAVVGQGRIERSFFQLVYLCLKHALKFFKVTHARLLEWNVLHAQNIHTAIDALDERSLNMKEFLQHQQLDVDSHVHRCASGMYSYHNNPYNLSLPSNPFRFRTPKRALEINPDEFQAIESELTQRDALDSQLENIQRLSCIVSEHAANYCDACRQEVIDGPRLICIECSLGLNLTDTVDFCAQGACKDATWVRSHTRTHDFIKVRRPTLTIELSDLFERANSIRKKWYASNAFQTDHTASFGGVDQQVDLACSICQTRLQAPEWVCLECDCCICDNCDKNFLLRCMRTECGNLFGERECVYEVSDGTKNSLLCNECVDSEMHLEKGSTSGVTGNDGDNKIGEVHEYCQDAEDSDSDDLHWDSDNDNDELILPVSSSSGWYFNDSGVLASARHTHAHPIIQLRKCVGTFANSGVSLQTLDERLSRLESKFDHLQEVFDSLKKSLAKPDSETQILASG